MTTSNEIPAADLPEQLKLLESHAADLAQNNMHADAERLYREILRAAPHNMAGLRYLAARAVTRREFTQAQRFVERAIKITPRKSALYQNLAIILRAQGRLEEALEAFRTALRLNPEQPLSWIQQGDVFQALGKTPEAIASYNQAAAIAGNLGILANAHRANPQAQAIIARAAKVLIKERTNAITKATADMDAPDGTDNLERAIIAGQHMAQSRIPKYADPLQKPGFCYFPGLDPNPFYEKSDFPFLEHLEKSHKLILNEFSDIVSDEQLMQPYIKIDPPVNAQWAELNYSPNWSSYHLYNNGQPIRENCVRCPETIRIIETLPLATVTNQAPEVFFSLLRPGTHIPPYYGMENYKLTVHLPLIIPKFSGIRVGDETKRWKPGKCLIFDDSFEHEAWNKSQESCAILSLEIWNPLIREEEKIYLNNAVAGLDNFQKRTDALSLALLNQPS